MRGNLEKRLWVRLTREEYGWLRRMAELEHRAMCNMLRVLVIRAAQERGWDAEQKTADTPREP